jgi:hypothetical protein
MWVQVGQTLIGNAVNSGFGSSIQLNSEGDILVIPNLSRKDLVYKRPNPASRPSVTLAQYTNTDRQSVQDQSRVQRLIQKAKTKKNGVKAPIPPNMLQQGQDAKVYKGGRIILGANLPTKKKTDKNSTT